MEIRLINPYAPKDNEYKGQIHFHTTESDGINTPTEMVTAYRDAGYDFVSIADHDMITADPGVAGILFIPGNEQTTAAPEHIVATNTSINTPNGDTQTLLDAWRLEGSVAFLAHLDYPGLEFTDEALLTYQRHYAIDISGGEDEWDVLLTNHLRCFGSYGDDSHGSGGATFDTKWIKVFADSLTVDDIMDALKTGNYYSSAGPDMAVSVSGNVITVTTPIAGWIAFIGKDGDTLQLKIGVTTSSYTVQGDEIYVRARIVVGGKKAWSNPVYISPYGVGDYSDDIPAATTGAKSFGRTERQDEIWGDINAIRGIVDTGLLGPEEAEYAGDYLELLTLYWDKFIAEYDAIHEAERTFG